MDENEFMRLLESYPVVRKKTHCRVQWNSMYDDEPAVKPASSGIFLPAGQENSIESTDSMEDALEKFLTPYFSSQEAARIQRELEKAQTKFLAGLCLEDIDDLCAQFVATK